MMLWLLLSLLLVDLASGQQCADVDPDCGPFANAGECAMNPAYMMPNCAMSCGMCSNGGGAPQPDQPMMMHEMTDWSGWSSCPCVPSMMMFGGHDAMKQMRRRDCKQSMVTPPSMGYGMQKQQKEQQSGYRVKRQYGGGMETMSGSAPGQMSMGGCPPVQMMQEKQCNCGSMEMWSMWGPWSGSMTKSCSATMSASMRCTRTRTCQKVTPKPTTAAPMTTMGMGYGMQMRTMAPSTGYGMQMQQPSQMGQQQQMSGYRMRVRRQGGYGKQMPATRSPGAGPSPMQGCVGPAMESRMCEMPMPMCAMWEEWGPWSKNHMTCMPPGMVGSQMMCNRKRTCNKPGQCQGKDMDTKPCQKKAPPCETCMWAEWSPFSQNSMTCMPEHMSGSMMMCMRQRVCQGESPSCMCPGPKEQQQMCPNRPPPCQTCSAMWSQWGPWSQNSMTCVPEAMKGSMMMCMRQRVCQGEGPSCMCPGPKEEQQMCPNTPPPCETCSAMWSQWGPWSQNSMTCVPEAMKGSMMMCMRQRTCQGEGPSCMCPGRKEEQRMCAQPPPCCSAMWSQWGAWSQNSMTCLPEAMKGAMIMCSRTRSCQGEGPSCMCPGKKEEQRMCAQPPPCCSAMWSQWGAWSQNSMTCVPEAMKGAMMMCMRTRTCMGEGPSCMCPGKKEEQQMCPQMPPPCCNAMWSEWGPWSQNSLTCLPPYMTGSMMMCMRTRSCRGESSSCMCQGKKEEQRMCPGTPPPCATTTTTTTTTTTMMMMMGGGGAD